MCIYVNFVSYTEWAHMYIYINCVLYTAWTRMCIYVNCVSYTEWAHMYIYINFYPTNAPDPFKSASYELTKWVRCGHLNAQHSHVQA